jgi:DNA-binding MarR family transcriptional regulator/N-acetylglutamate synthase-like GNAT family acetyltransferase
MEDPAAGRVAAVRQFNRFYTRRLGLLANGLYGSDFSLAEMRVLWELAHHAGVSASELEGRLGLDPGYMSRILRGLRERGLARAVPAEHDGRVRHLELTAKGRKAFAPFDRRSGEEVRCAIAHLSAAEQGRLVAAMRSIEALLEGDRPGTDQGQTGVRPCSDPGSGFTLREPRPGDFGWIVHRHGVVYAQEYGWGARFEALVADIVAKFVRELRPKRERCWIAERGGQIAGCVFLVERSATVAQLRLLLVEPSARGLGVGGELVAQCIAFARAAGYRKMVLWTNDILHAARRIYQRAGFELVKSEPHASFGHRLVGQTWELQLVNGREK